MFKREKRVLLRRYLEQGGTEGGGRPSRRSEPDDGSTTWIETRAARS